MHKLNTNTHAHTLAIYYFPSLAAADWFGFSAVQRLVFSVCGP